MNEQNPNIYQLHIQLHNQTKFLSVYKSSQRFIAVRKLSKQLICEALVNLYESAKTSIFLIRNRKVSGLSPEGGSKVNTKKHRKDAFFISQSVLYFDKI